jgi:hypothetical protein
MIIVRLMGGHSNQLFQYAVGRALADKHNTALKLDTESYLGNQPEQDTPRQYELGVYPLRASVTSRADIARVLPLDFQPGLAFKVAWRLGIDKHIRPFSEGGKAFNPKVLELPDNTYLNGWWQNEKYFKHIRQELIKDFEPKETMSPKNKKYLREIESSTSVSLHVRREDYVTNKHANKAHGLAPLAFYKAAFEHIKKVRPDKKVHVFVFSTDMPWCKRNIKLDSPVTFVEGNAQGSDDMRLMKHCQHNILANSSFSWWGAWLNQNPDKLVVAPKMWFKDEKENQEMELPKEWIRI